MYYKIDFLGSWCICDIFNPASENNPSEFHSTCDSKDVAIKIY